MRYLFDNDISPHLAAMLRALDVDVTGLRERWPSNTPDQEFLAALKHGEFDVYISHNTK